MAERWDTRRVRRWIGGAVLLATGGIVWLAIPRLGLRSPVAIVLLCVLAILTTKLVERQVHRWFQGWAERQARRTVPPKTGP